MSKLTSTPAEPTEAMLAAGSKFSSQPRATYKAMIAAAETPAAAEPCPTCSASEPYTGTCGTSNSDTRALCKWATQPAAGAALAPTAVVIERNGRRGTFVCETTLGFTPFVGTEIYTAVLAATPAPEPLTSNELYEIVRGTGYVTRDQACEIVDLILQAEKKE